MPTDATTIYNRAGTVHTWHWNRRFTRQTVMQSLCGLTEPLKNLQGELGGPRCKKCAAANSRPSK